jgi:hypothetical protein
MVIRRREVFVVPAFHDPTALEQIQRRLMELIDRQYGNNEGFLLDWFNEPIAVATRAGYQGA